MISLVWRKTSINKNSAKKYINKNNLYFMYWS